jgi:hypothetical protein
MHDRLLATDASLQKQALVTTPMSSFYQHDFHSSLWPLLLAPSKYMLPPSRSVHDTTPNVDNNTTDNNRLLSSSSLPNSFDHVHDVYQPAVGGPRSLPSYFDVYNVLSSLPWTTIISARWHFHQHINVLELHALLSAVRWVLSRPSSIGNRLLCLIDNATAAYSIKKGRARSRTIQSVLRIILVHLLAGQLSLLPMWVPSDSNPADRPSRC